MIGLAKRQGSLVDPSDLLLGFLRIALHEVLDQHRNIFFPLPERRHVNREDVQPIEEIGSKRAGRDCRRQITVRRGNHANVGRNEPVPSDSFKLPFLEHAQQRNLRLGGKVADLVQKNGAGVGEFEASPALLQGARECPLLVAKELRGDKRGRNRGAIHADKSMASALRSLMYGARDQFLPGTGLARNQHCRVGGSDLHDARKDGLQGGR